MGFHEQTGTGEQSGNVLLAAALVGSLLVAGCTSGTNTASPSPLPTSTVASPSEGCKAILVQEVDSSPKPGTTFEIGVAASWGVGTTIIGERFTFTRLTPDPHGRNAVSHTPVIGLDQGVLPSIFHRFPSSAQPEKFRVDGVVLTQDGRSLGGPQCSATITIVTIHERLVPQTPAEPSYL